MICDTTTTIDDLPTWILRGPTPRVYRDRQRETAILLARAARPRQQYTEALPHGPEDVFGITCSGGHLWLVCASLRDAGRALRRLKWTRESCGRNPTEDRAPEAHGHRRVCGTRGWKMARHDE